MKKLLSILLCSIILITACAFSVSAAQATISYTFSGSDKALAGYAEGTITLTAPAGTYSLYWADDEKALDGYYPLATLKLASSGSASHKMYHRTAVPADATRLIAVTGSDKSVKNAAAVYVIPTEKRFPKKTVERNYRFASYSDVHIDGVYKTYSYADEHLRCAFDTAAARDADFVALSGDYVNNNVDYSGISSYEWKTYERILSESDFCNPVYEAIGNHELWQGVANGTADFVRATGLDGDASTASKPYFEKTLGGDHFIFMAMEGGFYPDVTEEFTSAQLDWLEDLLKKYSGDGKNIYVIEHSLFYKYGAGDRVDGDPYYDIPLKDTQESTRRLKTIFETYKDVIFLSGHTHIAFKEQYNYSDNNGSSCQMIHNSSVGGTRPIVNGDLDRQYPLDQTEGFIVDVFDDGIIFNGANLYYNLYDPNCCYIVKPSSSFGKKSPASSGASATNYYLKGTFNSWGTSNPFYTTATTDVYETTIKLSAGSYEFKINTGGTWYGNEGVINDTTTTSSSGGWIMSSTQKNCTLNTSGGYYTFNFNKSTCKLKVFYSTTDPTAATQPTQPTTQPTTATEPPEEYILGDVNGDGIVSIRDVTTIQLYLARRLEFGKTAIKAADVDLNTTVDINDATYIQEYLVGLFGDLSEITEQASAKTVSDAKTALGKYYRYASYDSYQSLKKAYRLGAGETELKSRLNALLSKVDTSNVDGEITIFFEKPDSWTSVKAYVWGRKGAGNEGDWPGNDMTYVGKNSNGKKIYKYTTTNQRHNFVVFSNSSNADEKTGDVVISENYTAYYLSGSDVNSYKFKDSYIVG